MKKPDSLRYWSVRCRDTLMEYDKDFTMDYWAYNQAEAEEQARIDLSCVGIDTFEATEKEIPPSLWNKLKKIFSYKK